MSAATLDGTVVTLPDASTVLLHDTQVVGDRIVGAVVAEDAPLDVLLWPTLDDARYGDHFTLMGVATVRTPNREYVLWTYRDGKTRTFDRGEHVAVSVAI